MRVGWIALVLGLLMLPTGGPSAGWCDLLFKDVAREAAIVVVAELERSQGVAARVRVVDVLKGIAPVGRLEIDPSVLDSLSLEAGDRCVLALTRGNRLVQYVDSSGACSAISAIPLHRGKLRARDRENYDGRRKAMTIEELRADLCRSSEL